ncbi:hypothetical protein CR194_05400 [Salipaludibacillus keqinensis]|uniref:Serine hydrolase family protein n=1 Tax=Salipaludibacillus keqinensis TaxID=2045207 RepID=A0A323TR04_9BACI|nr:alpha/beta hydrolase [Salipaludibacillus keqinensis]PYZ94953.1 hypothetical protein CR194_05400 [Salipaludibacillus keqinensis]
MRKRILFIHSAGPQDLNQGSSGLKVCLQKNLGEEYALLAPKMPDPENPTYALWKAQLEKELASFEDEIILIGHSLGGSVLLKYLSEGPCEQPISALFMIASPYWGVDDDWRKEDFRLQDDFAAKLPHIPQIFLYHSQNEDIVPFAHVEHYKEKLPLAKIRIIDGAEHLFDDGLPELLTDLKEL